MLKSRKQRANCNRCPWPFIAMVACSSCLLQRLLLPEKKVRRAAEAANLTVARLPRWATPPAPACSNPNEVSLVFTTRGAAARIPSCSHARRILDSWRLSPRTSMRRSSRRWTRCSSRNRPGSASREAETPSMRRRARVFDSFDLHRHWRRHECHVRPRPERLEMRRKGRSARPPSTPTKTAAAFWCCSSTAIISRTRPSSSVPPIRARPWKPRLRRLPSVSQGGLSTQLDSRATTHLRKRSRRQG